MIAKVALPVPKIGPFDYAIPEGMRLGVGHRVKVRLGKRTLWGVVVALREEPEHRGPLQPILEDAGLVAPYWELPLFRELSRRYFVSLGMTLERSLPRPARTRTRRFALGVPLGEAQGMLEVLERRAPAQARALRRALAGPVEERALRVEAGVSASVVRALVRKGLLRPESLPFSFPLRESPKRVRLTPAQESAVDEVIAGLGRGRKYLLFGPPAAGKTEVYLRAARFAVERGRDALFLEPEVSLLPQLWTRVQNALSGLEPAPRLYFGEMPPGERWRTWEDALRGGTRVAVGTRSAAFLPFRNLGLLVVDEEHEPAYKQEEMAPHYHAREVGELRAEREGAALLLGSATPSVETFFRAERGEYELLELPGRVVGESPEVRAVPLEPEEVITAPLREAMERHLSAGGQVLLFLNRIGFFTGAACRDCGAVLRCDLCELALVFHLAEKTFRCHACGRSYPEPVCPRCGGQRFRLFGVGTERVEHEVRRFFPRARVARLDSETASKRAEILRALAEGTIDVLVGTQMVGKGLDFPRITLVGVINADGLLSVPDFRAGERTFQLLVAAAGRAGRGERRGEVIVQTNNADHYAIAYALRGDYRALYEAELSFRRGLRYPPFGKLVRILCEGKRAEERAGKYAEELARAGLEVLGPARLLPLRGVQRYQLLIRGDGDEVERLHEILPPSPPNVKVDPSPIRIG
ncbi:replication restart helicase PriA [Candidatus Bipolaricaulota sp. J31]